MITAKTVRLDMMKRYTEPINLVQYEVDARVLDIYLSAGTMSVNVEGASVVFYALKPDWEIVYNSCDIVDGAAGHVTYTATSQTCAVAGDLRCWLLVIKDDTELRSLEFSVTVHPSEDDTEAVESTSELTALLAALYAVDGLAARLTAVEESLGDLAMTDLADVGEDTPAKNDVVIFNGTEFVFAPAGTSFIFAIASFSTNLGSTTVLIGYGVWKAIGAITFASSYTNGPAMGAYVALSGWSNLPMGGAGLDGAVSVEAVNYPSVGGSRVFTLHAEAGEEDGTDSLTYRFYNKRFWGISSDAGSFDEADVEGMAGDELSNSRAKTFSVTAGAGEYIVYAYPSRLGAATFTVGGFEGGFEDPVTVSITNTAEYTEDYYVYRSTNAGLGTTTVVVS